MVDELPYCPDGIDYMWLALHDKYTRTALADGFKVSNFVQLMQDWKDGHLKVFFPVINDKPMGYILGFIEDDTFEGHYGFFKEYLGGPNIEAIKECMTLIREKYGITTFVSSIPKSNQLAISFAVKRLGFEKGDVITSDLCGDCIQVRKRIS